jgi:hypothetical protein
MTNRKPMNPVIAELEHETRHILKTTRFDVAAFKALSREARAARWRQWDGATKRMVVQQALLELRGTWYDAEVEAHIAHYDAKYGTAPTAAEVPDDAVAAELERLAEEHAQYAQTARAQGLKDDATYFRRSANSFVNGLKAWTAGVRPISLGRNKWLLPSNRATGAPHLLRLDGDWTCTCESGCQAHWASAICIAIEHAQDAQARDLAALEYTPADLGKRLALARMAAA